MRDLLILRPIQDEDIKLVESWIYKDYIARWFENPDEWIKEIKARFKEFSFINHFIIMYDNIPIGFCQYYDCLSANEVFCPDIPIENTFSIDYFIGEEKYLRKGLGKATINLLIQKIFNNCSAKRIVVQPDDKNIVSGKSLLANHFIYDEKNSVFYLNK